MPKFKSRKFGGNKAKESTLEKDLAQDLKRIESVVNGEKRAELDNAAKAFAEKTDTEFWFAIAFNSRQEKEVFLKQFNLFQLGDKYLWGRDVADALGNPLETETPLMPTHKKEKSWSEKFKTIP